MTRGCDWGWDRSRIDESRDRDILPTGFACGTFRASADTLHREDSETVVEAYYYLKVSLWLHIADDGQRIIDLAEHCNLCEAIVLGRRMQIFFLKISPNLVRTGRSRKALRQCSSC